MANNAVQIRKRKTKDVRVVFLVTEELSAKIRAAAEEEDESVGEWLRRAVEGSLLPESAKISKPAR